MDHCAVGLRVGTPSQALAVLLACLVVTGCSSTKMAYRYADWGIAWWLDDYVTLSQSQEQQLDIAIARLKTWHCSSELPRYRLWLISVQNELDRLDEHTLRPTAINELQTRLLAMLPPLLNQIAPEAVNLLASLENSQVEELARNMAEKHKALEQEYLPGSTGRRIVERAERTKERAEDWLGNLNGQQQDIINAWSVSRAGQTALWLEGRRKWQTALLRALENRHQPGFNAAVTQLIRHPEIARGEAYRQMINDSKKAMARMIYDLLAASQPAHIEHLQDRLSGLNSDFQALACPRGPDVALLPVKPSESPRPH